MIMGWKKLNKEMAKIEKSITSMGGNTNKTTPVLEKSSWDSANKALERIGKISKDMKKGE
jgi:hypothetical protein